jgi:Ca-activated chloride channel homolog
MQKPFSRFISIGGASLLLLLFCSCFALAAQSSTPSLPAAQVASGQEPFRVAVDMVNVLVVVSDRQGRLIPNLSKEDFSLFEEEIPQSIVLFTRETDTPLTVALLMDTSESSHPKLTFQKNAASNFFFSVLHEKDRGLLAEFDAGITLLQDFTNDPNRLEKAVRDIRAGGGTSLYDALYAISDEKMINEAGRKAIILVSDGDDTGSQHGMESALELAQRGDTTIYALSTSRGGFFGIPDKKSEQSDRVLTRMAEETGGRIYFPTKEEDLEADYQQISTELRNRYALGFISSNKAKDGKFRRLQVKIRNKDYRVQYRKGYYPPQN